MVTVAQLVAEITIRGVTQAQAQLSGLGASTDAASSRLRSFATGTALVVGAALIAIGVASLKMAGDFQQGVNRLRTGAGDTQDSFATLAKGILSVSVATGQLSGPLTNALYLILSSGQRGAQAFDTLAVAAKGAVIEQANVVDVANVVSGAMHNFGTKIFSATDYMNGLIKAVSEGKITLQDLSTSMGPLEPLAHQLGISYNDLASAMTTQTNAMIPAARAATSLRFMMQSLEVPTKKAKDAMAAMGLDSVTVGEEMKKSLPGALQMIYNAALKAGPEGSVPFNRAVSDMVGGQRSLSAFLALTGTHMKDFVSNSKAIADAMHNGTGGVKGWAIAQSNFNVIMDKAKASVQAAAIGLGLLLLPALGHLVSLVPTIVGYFTDFSAHAGVIVPILAGIGTIIVGLLVPAIWSLAYGMIAATWPVLLVAAAVAGLVVVFMHFYQQSAPFRTFINGLVSGLQAAWSAISANFIPALQEVGSVIATRVFPILQQIGGWLLSVFKPVWQQLVAVWQGQLIPTFHLLMTSLAPAMPFFEGLAKVIGFLLLVVLAALIGIVVGVIRAFANLVGSLAIVFGGIVKIISGAVSFIGALIGLIVDILEGHWNKIGADAAHMAQALITILSGMWDVISGLFRAAAGIVWGLVSGFIEGVVGFFRTLFNQIIGHSIIPDLINGIVSFFAGLPGRVFGLLAAFVAGAIALFLSLQSRAIAVVISLIVSLVSQFAALPGRALSAVSSLAGALAGFFGGLAGSALSWGAHIIENIASGIASRIGSVIQQAMNVASAIAGILAHTTPKIGPLSGDDQWMAHFGDNLAQGLNAQVGKVGRSAFGVALSISGAIPGSPTNRAMLPAGVQVSSASPAQNLQLVIQPQTAQFDIDGNRFMRIMMPYFVQTVRSATGHRTY